MSEYEKINIASFYGDGGALWWLQWWQEETPSICWWNSHFMSLHALLEKIHEDITASFLLFNKPPIYIKAYVDEFNTKASLHALGFNLTFYMKTFTNHL